MVLINFGNSIDGKNEVPFLVLKIFMTWSEIVSVQHAKDLSVMLCSSDAAQGKR